MLGVLVEQEVEMFELASTSRQRECVVIEMVRESIPSRRTGRTERASSICGQYESRYVMYSTMWMKTIQQDLESFNLSLNEAIDVAQNHPLWRLMSTFGTMHCHL